MKCPHEFFKPGSLKCARCGEPGRYPASAMSRHTRVGEPDSQAERWIAGRELPGSPWHEAECLYAEDDSHAGRCAIDARMVGGDLVRATGVKVSIATREMRAGVQA